MRGRKGSATGRRQDDAYCVPRCESKGEGPSETAGAVLRHGSRRELTFHFACMPPAAPRLQRGTRREARRVCAHPSCAESWWSQGVREQPRRPVPRPGAGRCQDPQGHGVDKGAAWLNQARLADTQGGIQGLRTVAAFPSPSLPHKAAPLVRPHGSLASCAGGRELGLTPSHGQSSTCCGTAPRKGLTTGLGLN